MQWMHFMEQCTSTTHNIMISTKVSNRLSLDDFIDLSFGMKVERNVLPFLLSLQPEQLFFQQALLSALHN